MWRSRDPLLEFFWPRGMWGTIEAWNVAFGTEADGSDYQRQKMQNEAKSESLEQLL